MAFKEYKRLDLPKIAEDVLSYWETEAIFEQSIRSREGKPPFVFYEGPPSANGMPGIHHVMARAIKDIFCRYKTQKGYQVKRKAGWDTHGLPVELGVEKELEITKDAIGKSISIEAYNEACKKAVMRYTDVWNQLTLKMGYWVDMENPYITYKSKYIESVWWLLKQIHQKDLLYKGYTIQPFSPKAGTGLSSHELNQPGTYRDVTDTTVTAMFETQKDSLPSALQEELPLYILAWTTTPWTLPSNTALTVGAKIDYIIVHTFNQYTDLPIRVLLAKKLVKNQLGKKFVEVKTIDALQAYENRQKQIPYYLGDEIKGNALVGIRYQQLWDEAPLPSENPDDAFRVIAGDFVTTEEGTGIVHTAPTFGADDAKVAMEAKPPIPPLRVADPDGTLVPLVDFQGKFRNELGSLGGKYVKNEYYPEGQVPEKSVDVEIAIRLKERNRAFKVEKYVHSYPNCWRTDKPILYYPLDSWFVKMTAVRDRMVANNNKINWKPKSTGEGRFGNWLQNANDWNLSRSRFWGIPLPIWRSEDGKQMKVIGSLEELDSEIQSAVKAGIQTHNPLIDFEVGNYEESNYEKIDLHKNTLDAIILVGEDGHTPLHRENDLIDVWFDSGSMPYAQWHYPFENKEKVDRGEAFPADYIAEGVDQTRGWFYTLHAIATLVFDQIAFKNVISNGLILDKKGQKMSKRLGNATDPFETLDQYGPDATRWYMIANANPWDNLKFDVEGIEEVQRKFFGTLYNTYSFFSLYSNIDQFQFKEATVDRANRTELDRWILSELHSLITQVDADYADYEPTRAARAISEFVQEKLSNWYVRLNRRRFWKGSYGQDKIAAYQTLFESLLTVAKLAAPIAPFYSDHLYQDLIEDTGVENYASVHLSEFPKPDPGAIDAELEARINKARLIVSLGLSLRKKEQIRVRQPLQKLMIPVKNQQDREQLLSIEEQIKTEINVKELELLDDASTILVKEIKPNFKTLGPRFGKEMGSIINTVKSLSEEQIRQLEEQGQIELNVNEKNIILEDSDVEISTKDIPGWLIATGQGITVALDSTLNEGLVEEGISRELVNRIQNIRKDAGLEVTDKIAVRIAKHEGLEKAVLKNKHYVMTETLTDHLEFVPNLIEGQSLTFDEIDTRINIQKI